jgi:hypothetical protein
MHSSSSRDRDTVQTATADLLCYSCVGVTRLPCHGGPAVMTGLDCVSCRSCVVLVTHVVWSCTQHMQCPQDSATGRAPEALQQEKALRVQSSDSCWICCSNRHQVLYLGS